MKTTSSIDLELQGLFIWLVLLEFRIYAVPPWLENRLKAGLQRGSGPTRSQMTKPCLELVPLIHRGNESMPDVLAWLTAQNKRSGEDPSGIGSSGDGHSRR